MTDPTIGPISKKIVFINSSPVQINQQATRVGHCSTVFVPLACKDEAIIVVYGMGQELLSSIRPPFQKVVIVRFYGG